MTTGLCHRCKVAPIERMGVRYCKACRSVCPGCGGDRGPTGVRCKSCAQAYLKEWRERNKSRRRLYARHYYRDVTACPEVR